MRIGLALSGGAARGIAHIGVLKYLEERGVKPCCIAGTSAGSIVGSYYGAGYSADRLQEAVSGMTWKNLIKVNIPRKGLINSDRLLEMLKEHLGQRSFDDLNFPLSVNAVDLLSGEEVVMSEGIVAEAVVASCAIPGIFTPVRRGNRLLVDGGLIANVPVAHLRERDLDYIIAVNVGREKPLQAEPGNIFEILAQASYILRQQRDAEAFEKTDILIEPWLADIHFYDNSKVELLVERGYEAARQELDRLDLSRKTGRFGRWLARRRREHEKKRHNSRP